MSLDQLLSQIAPVDGSAAGDCIARFDRVAKPVGSLGKLEELLSRIAAITGSAEIDIRKKSILVFCADNGVVRQGVAQSGHEVTAAIAGMLQGNRASISRMAKATHATVLAVDVGMVDTVAGLRARKLMRGTNDITQGPAMSREIAEEAIRIGMETVAEQKAEGCRLLATGEAGIGNTTASSALCSVLLARPVPALTGRGAGLDDAGLQRKIAAIERAIAVNRPDPSDPLDVLHKLGGLDIAALTGVFLGGALQRIPVVMDGFISAAAALLAARLCPAAKDYILPSHESSEPGARFLLEELGFSPILHGEMRLGEGTGAALLFPLLDMAAAVYRDAATFSDIQVEAYKRSP